MKNEGKVDLKDEEPHPETPLGHQEGSLLLLPVMARAWMLKVFSVTFSPNSAES